MNTQKLATLSIDSNLRPILVLDPGSHLAIGKVVRALKQMRSGLWPKYLGDTDILISASQGKENEIYKLAATLTAKGYLLQETEEHKNLDQKLAARAAQLEAQKAAIQERAAQAAIPPHSFASKRFSFRWHPRGIQVSFLSQGDFTRWAEGHSISFSNLSRHRAIISKQDFFALDMPMKALKGKASRFLPGYGPAQCAWVQPPAETTAEPVLESEPRPDSTWTRDQIKGWLSSQGIDTLGITRKAELLELVNSI